jgi:microcompartment protein CcmK/EutM
MNLARVSGTVIATKRSDGLQGAKWLLVEECDPQGTGRGDCLVALDMVGAGRGQMVLLTQGSSCRWTRRTEDRPIDTLVVAIVDSVDQCEQEGIGSGGHGQDTAYRRRGTERRRYPGSAWAIQGRTEPGPRIRTRMQRLCARWIAQ